MKKRSIMKGKYIKHQSKKRGQKRKIQELKINPKY